MVDSDSRNSRHQKYETWAKRTIPEWTISRLSIRYLDILGEKNINNGQNFTVLHRNLSTAWSPSPGSMDVLFVFTHPSI